MHPAQEKKHCSQAQAHAYSPAGRRLGQSCRCLLILSRICGSDLHNYLAGGVGGRPVTEPIVMGHESSGEVIAVGDLVKTHKVGDRVASK